MTIHIPFSLGGITAAHRPTYNRWKAMVARCEKPHSKDYARYGGRGIRVCERWLIFANFLEDMGDAPNGLTLDRSDNARGYEPGNCQWVSASANARNRRCTRRVVFEGVETTVPDLCERFDRDVACVYQRLYLGWTIESALSEPGIGPYRTNTRPKNGRRAA